MESNVFCKDTILSTRRNADWSCGQAACKKTQRRRRMSWNSRALRLCCFAGTVPSWALAQHSNESEALTMSIDANVSAQEATPAPTIFSLWPPSCGDVPVSLGAAWPPCREGYFVLSGGVCTPRCDSGYVPSVSQLSCDWGVLSPPTYDCEPLPCRVPELVGGTTLRCSPRLNWSHVGGGGTCVAQCGHGLSPSVPAIRCAGGSFVPSTTSCEPSPCFLPDAIDRTSGQPCVEVPVKGANRHDHTLLFTGLGRSRLFRNAWAGWYNPGFFANSSGDGKRPAYDEAPLVGLRFEDDRGAFANFRLTQEFAQKSLLQIVHDCIGTSPARNTGSDDWLRGHCNVAVRENASDIADVGQYLRLGVGATSGQEDDWALFMLRGGTVYRFERNDEYAFGSQEETNTGYHGRVSILGVQSTPAGMISHGAICTTRCDGLYAPSVPTLSCSYGALSPPRFACQAASCSAPLVKHGYSPTCLEGPVIAHGDTCTPRCENPLFLASGAARLTCKFGVFDPPTFTCVHSCDGGTVQGLQVFARSEHLFKRRSYTGPALYGSGLELGPASLGDRSKAAAEWRAGLSPERWRFSALGAHGPPTSHSRRIAEDLAIGFGCRVCQQMINTLWKEVVEPSKASTLRWISEGCSSLVRRALLRNGWHLTSTGCGGAGLRSFAVDGTWCFLQDLSSAEALHPALAEEYDPARDALFRICENTLGANAPRIAGFLEWQRNGTRSGQRNEHLSQMTCTQAACCSEGVDRVKKTLL